MSDLSCAIKKVSVVSIYRSMLCYALGKQIIQSNLSHANSSTDYLFWCSVVSGKTNHGIVLGSTSVCKSESTG
jgi:hypothetical protein